MPYKEQYNKNKELYRKSSNEYYWKNRDKVNQKRREEYHKNPKNRENICKKQRNYYQNNKEKVDLANKKYAINNPKIIRKIKSNYKKNHSENMKIKFKNDGNYRLVILLRNRLRKTLIRYTKTGKIMSSEKYGIDYKAIIEHLKPFPKELSKYHIDHIRPLCSFHFVNEDGSTNLDEVKKAFTPENHQWLTAKENNLKRIVDGTLPFMSKNKNKIKIKNYAFGLGTSI